MLDQALGTPSAPNLLFEGEDLYEVTRSLGGMAGWTNQEMRAAMTGVEVEARSFDHLGMWSYALTEASDIVEKRKLHHSFPLVLQIIHRGVVISAPSKASKSRRLRRFVSNDSWNVVGCPLGSHFSHSMPCC